MVAFVHRSSRQQMLRSLPLYGAVAGGLIAAVVVLVISTAALEALVWTTGVAALIPMAAPPLGMTARILLALGSGVLVGAVLWSSLYLLFGPGGPFAKRPRREDGVPVVRRADAHPDAPPRKPMSAADLGTPMMEVGVGGSGGARDERPIPADLDQPLAAFDPNAIRPVPMEPVRPVMPLAQATILAPVIDASPTAEPETFVTAPLVEPVEQRVVVAREPAPDVSAPTPIPRTSRAPVQPSTPATIETLLQRLEQGARRRGRIGSH
jgi:hypothetical protein